MRKWKVNFSENLEIAFSEKISMSISKQALLWLFLLIGTTATLWMKYGFVLLIAALIAKVVHLGTKTKTFNGKALVFLLLFLPFYSLLRVAIINIGIDLKIFNYIRDLVIAAMAVPSLVDALKRKPAIRKLDWLWIIFIVNWAVGAVTSVLNGYLTVGLTGLHYVAIPAVLYLIIRYGECDLSGKQIMDTYIRTAVVVGIVGLMVYVFRPAQYCELFRLSGNTVNPWTYIRMVSVFLTPNVCGNYFAIAVACALAQWMSGNRHRLAPLALFLVCVVLSMSRGAWLFLGVIVIAFCFVRPKTGCKLLIVGAIVFLFVMLDIGNLPMVGILRDRILSILDFNNLSSYDRITTWINALSVVIQHPLGLGLGVGTTAQITHGTVAEVAVVDSFYVKTIIETGLLGVVFCVAFITWGIITSVSSLTKKKTDISACACFVCLGCLIQAIPSNVFDFVCTAPWFWLFLGLAAKEDATEQNTIDKCMKKNRLRILYLNNTPWDWILQRSQMLALGLDKKFDCVVLDRYFLLAKSENLNNPQPQKLVKIPQLRGGGKIDAITKLNDFVFAAAIRYYIKDCDVVWCSYASFGKFIPKKYAGCVVYDCMDNHVAMAPEKNKEKLRRDEQVLVSRSDIRICSSQKLTEAVSGMKDAHVVRNGFVPEAPLPAKSPCIKDQYTVGYFGAIEHWFDFEKLTQSTKQFAQLEYRLIGPFSAAKFSSDEKGFKQTLDANRIYFEGIIKHDDLKDYVKDYDALIMPFKVNDVILSVDPVKLYEYICYGKCVISVWYPEIDRFSPYVYFYRNEEEFLALMEELVQNGFAPKYDTVAQTQFLNDNTWEKRCDSTIQLIENHFNKKNI